MPPAAASSWVPSAPLLAVLLAAALAAGCSAAREPRRVTFPEGRARPAPHIDGIHDYRTAVASIMRTLERTMGIEPFPVTVRLYPNREAFAAALVEAGHDPAFASTTARTMIAVGGHRGVLLNEGAIGFRPWPDRTLLLAHELTHTLQYKLGGGVRGTSDQWIREGFAEWLSVRVLERLDGISLQAYRRQRQIELRSIGRAELPRLAEMITFHQWVRLGERRGASAYALAFLAVELLVEGHGLPATLGYFSRFAASQDRVGNFRAAFGQDLEVFETLLRQKLGIIPAIPSAHRPPAEPAPALLSGRPQSTPETP